LFDRYNRNGVAIAAAAAAASLEPKGPVAGAGAAGGSTTCSLYCGVVGRDAAVAARSRGRPGVFAVALLAVGVAHAAYSPTLIAATGAMPLRTHGGTTLYSLTVPNAVYTRPVYVWPFANSFNHSLNHSLNHARSYLIDVNEDSRYDMGFSYGVLLGAQTSEVHSRVVVACLPLNIFIFSSFAGRPDLLHVLANASGQRIVHQGG
jgi:hypothetical protein